MTSTEASVAVRVAPEDRRPEIRAGLWALLVVVGLGLLGGVVWGLLAPAETVVISQRGSLLLTGESGHQFDAIAIFLCFAGVLGAVAAIGAWQWRRMRGPILFAGMLIGAAVGGAAMWLVGDQVARWRHPKAIDPHLYQVVSAAPTMSSDAALFAAPFVAAFMLAVLVILSPSDDLGSGRGPQPELPSPADAAMNPVAAP
jgi:hypothetical protein